VLRFEENTAAGASLERRVKVQRCSKELLSISVDQAVGRPGELTRQTWITVAVMIVALVLMAYILFKPVTWEGTGTRSG
jgi:hypothetical protein